MAYNAAQLSGEALPPLSDAEKAVLRATVRASGLDADLKAFTLALIEHARGTLANPVIGITDGGKLTTFRLDVRALPKAKW